MVMYRATPNGQVEMTAQEEADFIAMRDAAIVPRKVSMRNARLALLDASLLTAVDTHIQTLTDTDKIHWQYATEIHRDHPLVASVQAALSWTDTQVDNLFIAAGQK